MPDLLPGTTVTATDTPPTVSSVVDPSFDTTVTAYGTGSSGGSYADVSAVFTAPTTGRVVLHLAARLINTGTGGTLVCCETREGDTVGSGTVVDTVGDRGPSHYGASFARLGATRLLTGLTPGASYNTRMLHKVTSGTGSVALRELVVVPAT